MTRRFDVVCLGEALVDMLPSRAGPLAEIPSFARHAGGAPANVAVGVARLGGRCAFIGTVGRDPFGEFLQSFLWREGVDVTRVRAVAGLRTGVAFVSLNEHGQPAFFSAGRGGAELALEESDVAGFPIEDCAILHLGTYALSSESGRAAAFSALTRARSASVLVALDPNLRLHLWNDRAALERLVPELVRQSDVVKLSSDECEFVTGVSDPAEAARSLLEAGPSLAIVTAGARGCFYARRVGSVTSTGAIPARPVRVVDSTGAGDGFMAVLLRGLAHDGLSISDARLELLLRFAVEAGARVCEHVGAMAGLPTTADLGFEAFVSAPPDRATPAGPDSPSRL